MNSRLLNSLLLACFAATIFISAFLLFQVQPLMGKYILPWFGGSPGVWTTCMLVFQVLLFGGYAYAHALNRFLGLRAQVILHCVLLGLALVTLPITPTADWKPTGDESPTWKIMALLLCKVGAPYFLLSSTGPLLQSWLGQTNAVDRPYRLYSLSNFGSMLALLSFPFLIEPAFSSSQQSMIWSIAFGGFALLCGISGWWLCRSQTPTAQSHTSTETASSLTLATLGGWFVLAMLPSVMLLATTNQICLDTGVIPFLWVIPLAIYLLTFILTFESDRWYSRRPYIMAATLSFLALYVQKLLGNKFPLMVELGLHFSGLFCACMVCHGELVRRKPYAQHLTTFYLTLSAGGACGGIFVGLVAPVLFRGYFEWQLGLFACILVFLETYLQANRWWTTRVPTWGKCAIAGTFPVLAIGWISFFDAHYNRQLAAKRNFYGVLSVTDAQDEISGMPIRNLVHGRIVHGSQFQKPELRRSPTTYYTPTSGVGLALQHHAADQARHVGVVGLGAGTLACYAKPQDRFRFYEINPHVLEMADEYFTFLDDCPGEVQLVLGDARLTLERESPQNFDVLVLDAFSGDAIPVHLLTREAMKTYRRHLKPDGVLAIHISNLYFDLRSIVSGLALGESLQCRIVPGQANASLGALNSTWVLMANEVKTIETAIAQAPTNPPVGKPIFWTDDRSNLFEALNIQ